MKTKKGPDILLVSPTYAPVESIMKALGQISLQTPSGSIDENPKTVSKIIDCALAHRVRAVVLDNRMMPCQLPAFTPKMFEAAALLKEKGVETFFALRDDMGRCRYRGDATLWQSHAQFLFHGIDSPVACLAQVGKFGTQPFDRETGKPFVYSGGDGGMEDLQLALGRGRAFDECNWPEAFENIRSCINR